MAARSYYFFKEIWNNTCFGSRSSKKFLELYKFPVVLAFQLHSYPLRKVDSLYNIYPSIIPNEKYDEHLLNEFVTSLMDEWNTSITLEENLQQYMNKNKTCKQVIKIIRKALDDIT